MFDVLTVNLMLTGLLFLVVTFPLRMKRSKIHYCYDSLINLSSCVFGYGYKLKKLSSLNWN